MLGLPGSWAMHCPPILIPLKTATEFRFIDGHVIDNLGNYGDVDGTTEEAVANEMMMK
jgi:hypothetical protein